MGLTYSQAKRLGLGDLHPAASGARSKERELIDRYGAPVQSKAPSDGMNKLERAFRDLVLEPAWVRGDLARYYREPVKLRLAGRTWYMPDFLVAECMEYPVMRLTLVEVKGFMRDDAAVKLKVAASLYPHFRWLLVRRERVAGWLAWEVDGRGIGADSIYVPWIHGR
jgi:hypothetical protein